MMMLAVTATVHWNDPENEVFFSIGVMAPFVTQINPQVIQQLKTGIAG